MYHSSVGSPVAEFVTVERPEPLIVDYHNITPSFVLPGRWEPSVVGALNRGAVSSPARAAKPRSASPTRRSTRGARETRHTATAVVPIMLDIAEPRTQLSRSGGRRADRKARVNGGSDWLFVGRVAPNKAQHDIVKGVRGLPPVPRSPCVLRTGRRLDVAPYATPLRVLRRRAGAPQPRGRHPPAP